MNLATHIRDDSQDRQGLDYMENNVQGSDMSFDLETLRTLPVVDGAQSHSDIL